MIFYRLAGDFGEDMEKQKTERSVSIMLSPATFLELESKSYDENRTLSNTYILAIEEYLEKYTPDRASVMAAPRAGKRIRVILDRELYTRLSLKVGTTGFDLKDVIYTSFEVYLKVFPKLVAA